MLSLHWVKERSNIFANVIADLFANTASFRGDVIDLKFSLRYIKTLLKKTYYGQWNHIWNTEGRSKVLFSCIPNISLIPDNFPSSYAKTLLQNMDVFLFFCLENSCGMIQRVFVVLISSVTHFFDSCPLCILRA